MIDDILEEVWYRTVQFVDIWFALLHVKTIGQVCNIQFIISLGFVCFKSRIRILYQSMDLIIKVGLVEEFQGYK